MVQVAPRDGRSCLDDDCEDAGRHAPHLQNRNPTRACREKSSAARRDALEDRLQGRRHHARANAFNPEGPPLPSPLHFTLVLTCAATALRASEMLALRWSDLLWEEGRIRISKRWANGEDGETKTESSNGYVPLHTVLARFLRAWRAQTPFASDGDFVFPSLKAAGRVPLSASIFVADHLRPAAKKAGVHIEDGQRFGLHNLRHSLSNWLVNKAKVEPKTVQGILRHAKIQTTLDLYAQDDGEETRAAQGEYLTALGVGTQMVQ